MSVSLSVPQIGLSLAAGGLTTLSPCVLPLLPLVVGGALQGNRFAPLAMGVGMIASFALIGMLLGALGPALGEHFSRWMLPIASQAQAASALSLVASEGGVARGGLVLGIFGLGAAMPLVAVACASRAGFVRARDWVLARVERVRLGFALLLAAMGVAILTGADKWLEAQVLRVLPDAWVNLMVGIRAGAPGVTGALGARPGAGALRRYRRPLPASIRPWAPDVDDRNGPRLTEPRPLRPWCRRSRWRP